MKLKKFTKARYKKYISYNRKIGKYFDLNEVIKDGFIIKSNLDKNYIYIIFCDKDYYIDKHIVEIEIYMYHIHKGNMYYIESITYKDYRYNFNRVKNKIMKIIKSKLSILDLNKIFEI